MSSHSITPNVWINEKFFNQSRESGMKIFSYVWWTPNIIFRYWNRIKFHSLTWDLELYCHVLDRDLIKIAIRNQNGKSAAHTHIPSKNKFTKETLFAILFFNNLNFSSIQSLKAFVFCYEKGSLILKAPSRNWGVGVTICVYLSRLGMTLGRGEYNFHVFMELKLHLSFLVLKTSNGILSH